MFGYDYDDWFSRPREERRRIVDNIIISEFRQQVEDLSTTTMSSRSNTSRRDYRFNNNPTDSSRIALTAFPSIFSLTTSNSNSSSASLSNSNSSSSSSALLQNSSTVKLDWEYECIGLLGRGSFANVYVAKKSSGREVAIKLFKLDNEKYYSNNEFDQDSVQQEDSDDILQLRYESFQREIDTIAKLPDRDKNGRNRDLSICYFEDWFEEEKNNTNNNSSNSNSSTPLLQPLLQQPRHQKLNFTGIVMQYVNGGTLAMEIESKSQSQQSQSQQSQQEPYTERRIAWYALQLCEALAFMHENGIAHYDVKSSNILIDRDCGDKLILTDFGNTVPLLLQQQREEREEEAGRVSSTSSASASSAEPSGFTEMYAAPELLRAHYNTDNNSNDNSVPAAAAAAAAAAANHQQQQDQAPEEINGEKVDAFGLGAILFELVCSQQMKEMTGDDETIGEFITRAGVDALLNLPCVRLPWLPSSNDNNNNNDDGNSHVVGYSDSLKNLIKSLLVPDPNQRWTPRTLEGHLRNDPKSPLLADFIVAAQPQTPGAQVTVDNIQLGMFVQHGQDWDNASPHNNSDRQILGGANSVGVIVGLNPDAGYCHVQWPTMQQRQQNQQRQQQAGEWMCCRIGANNKYELQIGPTSLPDFVASTTTTSSSSSGEAAATATRMSGMIPVPDTDIYTIGQFINNDTTANNNNNSWVIVAIQKEKKCIFVAPTSGNFLNPVQRLRHSPPRSMVLPPPPTQQQQQQQVPKHWQLDAGLFVEIHDRPAPSSNRNIAMMRKERQMVYDMFFSEGGMDLSAVEITSIQRVQSEALWKTYTANKDIVESEHWGIANERRFFHGISLSFNGRGGPIEDLIQRHNNPGGATEFYKSCINNSTSRAFSNHGNQLERAEIRFPLSVVAADRERHTVTQPTTLSSPVNGAGTSSSSSWSFQLVLSKVVLGRVRSDENYRLFSRDTTPANGDYHSQIKDNHATANGKWVSIQNPLQAYPEYIVTYKNNPGAERRQLRAARPNPFGSNPTTNPFGSPPTSNPFLTSRATNGPFSIFAAASTDDPFGIQERREPRVTRYPGAVATTAVPPAASAGRSAGEEDDRKQEAAKTPPPPTKKKKDDEGEPSPSPTKMCVVCWERPVNQVLIPCGHPCLCEICSTAQGLAKMKRLCPECRQPIHQTMAFFGRVVND